MNTEGTQTPPSDSVSGEEARKQGLQKAVFRGSLATVVGRLAMNVVRFASNLVLTRVLLPEDFGVMVIVNVTMTGLQMFSDLGIGTAVIQSEHGDEPLFLHTAFTLQVIRGVVLTLIGCLLAWPVHRFYESMPGLLWMIPVASLTALIEGFVSTKALRATRQLRLVRITIIDLCTALFSAGTMIAVAVTTRSIVALLVGGIAGGLLRVILTHVWLEGERDRFAWDREIRNKLLRFSRWIFLSTATTFVSMQVDRLTIGRWVPAKVLGVYSIATMMSAMPREIFSQIVERVIYPLVARMCREGAKGAAIRTIRMRMLTMLVVPFAILGGESTALFRLFFNEKYQAGGPIMAAMCIGGWLAIVNMSYGIVVLAKGWPRFITYGTALKTVAFAVVVYPIYKSFGVLGVATLISLSEIAVIAAVAFGCRTLDVTSIAFDIGCSLFVVVAAFGIHHTQAWTTAVLGSVVPGIVLFAVLALLVPALSAKKMGLLQT